MMNFTGPKNVLVHNRSESDEWFADFALWMEVTGKVTKSHREAITRC